MRKGHARILSIILMLCMIISTQSFAFAAASDGVERTLKSPVAGGFKIVDSESGDLIKNVTMELYSETGQRMGKTLCSDGQNFEMNDIEQGRTDHFTFSAANYETLTMKAQKDVIANLGVGPVWFNGGATERYIMAASVPLAKSAVTGIHTCKGTITVTESGTGAAIENAKFLLVDSNDVTTVKYEVPLEADGSFIIENIVPGAYKWTVEADGYETYLAQTGSMGGLANQTDAKIADLRTKAVALNKIIEGSASIAGKVTDIQGEPIEGAQVQLKQGTVPIGAAVKTAVDGTYTINKVEAGAYTLEASAEGYDKATIEAFDVADGETIADKNISLEKAVRVTVNGKVTDIDGQPIKGYVSVYVSQNGVNVGHGTVNEAGEFTLTQPKGDGKLAPGEYEISIHSKGYLDQNFTFVVPRQETYTLDTIKLALDPIKDATITGYLLDAATGEPIAKGCSVSISKDGKMLGSDYVNPGEEFSFDPSRYSLRAGTYVISVSPNEYIGYGAAESQPIVLEDKTYEQIITNQNLYLQPIGETKTILGGFITADDQSAGNNVTVNLLQDGQIMYDTQCVANGNYLFKDIQPGTYTVEAQAEGYVSASIENVTVKDGKSLGGNNLAIYKKVVLERIEITKLPDRTVYEAGEDTLNTTGMEVTAFYSNGTSKVLTDDEYTLSGYGLTTGKNIIVVTYSDDGVEQETLLTVTVKAPELPGDNTTGSDKNDQNGNAAAGSNSDKNAQDGEHAATSDNAAKTGDNMNIGALLALMALCGTVAAGVLLTRRKEA